jgi:hypothetical protein
MWTALMAALLAQAGPACELHVWGSGRPNFVYSGRLLKNIDPASIDKSNPYATINTFNTVTRALALPDADLARLIPGAQVRVVRHETMIDTDKTPLDKAKGRLAASDAPCYADLVVANSYGIFPAGRERDAMWPGRGLVVETMTALLAGDDRLVLEFRLRDFTSPAAAGREIRRKNDTPLPHVPIMSAEMKDAIEASALLNLRSFVAFVDRKRGR